LSRFSRTAANWAVAGFLAALIVAVTGIATAGADESGPSGDHLVISRIPSISTAQGITLVRVNGAGTSDGSNWALPTTASGSNKAITLQGDSNAVGALARSVDKRYVTMAGYQTAVGGNPEATGARVVARIDASGTVDTSTTLGKTFEKEKIRGAATSNGTGFWVTGNGNGSGNTPLGGMIYQPLGATGTPTVIVSKEAPSSDSNKALNNFRTVQIAGGNLYTGSEKGTAGVYTVPGLPTKPTTSTNIINLGTSEVDPICELPLEHEVGSGKVDLMYVVRENEGIYKYSLNGSTWTERGKIASGSFSGITGKVDSEGHFRLYVISGYGAANSVVTLTDKAAFNAAPSASPTTTVSTAAAGTAYRGVAFAPEAEESVSLPGAPTGVSASAGNAKATLSWTAPGDTGGSPITSYKIVPFKAGVAQTAIETGSGSTEYTVEGLTNGTEYTFTVAATTAKGTGPASAASSPVTPQAPGAATPTITLSDSSLSGTVSDPTNPTVDVTIGQTGVEAKELTVAATASTKTSVATSGGVSVTGSGVTRTVSVTPAGGVGFADITLKVTGLEGKSATTTLHYAASANTSTPATSRYHTFASDASTAVDVGGGYMLLGNDENNVIRMYKRDTSGAPVKTWDFNSQMGSPEEIDIEASARVGDTIYWTGSMGNSKKGNLKPDRSILFTTKVSGSGAATELSFGGYYRGLRADLIKWDEEHGNQFGFAAGAAAGNIPKQINGFNVEGMEFAPGSTESGYVGFRAPLSPAKAGGKAIVVPVTNLAKLATTGQNTTVHATFGSPILMDLGGLSVREIRRNAADEYLIIAGSWAATGPQALYTWDGVAADPPVKVLTDIGAAEGGGEEAGAYEGIVATPEPLASGDDIQLVADVGATDLYDNGQEAKEQIAEFQKSRSDHFTLQLPVTAPANVTPPVATGVAAVGHPLSCAPGEWSGSPAFAYAWLRDGGAIAGAEASTYTTVPADAGTAVSCEVTATNSGGTEVAFSNTITMPGPGLFCSGTNIIGTGSVLQGTAQDSIWAPQLPASVCPGGPTVFYEFDNDSAPQIADLWHADGTAGPIGHEYAFLGTDQAPNATQIANIDAAAGVGVQLAVVPVAQTSIAVVANPPGGCTVEEVTSGDLTAVFEGRFTKWSQLDTAEGNCSSSITRVVPLGTEAVTAQFKNYLYQLNKKALACAPGKATWQGLVAANTAWPEACAEKALSALVRPGLEGGRFVAGTVNATAGSIGFATLREAEAEAAPTLRLQDNGFAPAGEAAFASPKAGAAANCSAMTYKRPAGGGGLDLDWSGVFGAKPAIGAGAYPLCMLTYVLAFHGYEAAGFPVGVGATVKDYVNGLVVTDAGQAGIEGDGYAPLPTSSQAQFDVLGEARKAAGKIAR